MPTSTPGKTPPSAPIPTSDGTTRQRRLFKTLAGVLLAALVGGAGWLLYARHMGQPVTVLLDGRPITTVRNYATANALLSEAERAKVGGGYPEESIKRQQKVQYQHVVGRPVDADPVARGRLKSALKLHVRAFVILVNGKASLGLPSDEIATDTLHRVKEHFAQMPPQADLIGEPTFVQRVTVKRQSVDGGQAKSSAAAAAPYFWTPPSSRTYTVRRGDTGMVIARRSHISLSEFISANAGRNINRLTPGDKVNVQRMPLLLTVQVKKRLRREEKIVQNAPESEAGRRAVTYAVTYTDGLEVSKEVMDMATLEPPRARRSL